MQHKIFSERLKKTLVERKMTQCDLVSASKVSRNSISKYANGICLPSGTHLIAIAEALDVSADYLLGLNDKAKVNKTIDVSSALQYCEERAEKWAAFSKKALSNIELGNDYTGSCNAVVYGTRQEQLYRHEIPDVIRAISQKIR